MEQDLLPMPTIAGSHTPHPLGTREGQQQTHQSYRVQDPHWKAAEDRWVKDKYICIYMINFNHSQGNASQNNNEKPFLCQETGKHYKDGRDTTLVKMWETGQSHNLTQVPNLPYLQKYGGVSGNVKRTYTLTK